MRNLFLYEKKREKTSNALNMIHDGSRNTHTVYLNVKFSFQNRICCKMSNTTRRIRFAIIIRAQLYKIFAYPFNAHLNGSDFQVI